MLFAGDVAELPAAWQRRGSDAPPAWRVRDGVLTPAGGDIVTRRSFGDFQLHLEFRVPLMPDRKGQSRGNSGVKLQGRYEIQILDSFGNPDPGTGDCGALYTVAAPLVNACRPPEEWQTFDITFRAPRVSPEGAVTEAGRVTVLQNGIVVLNNQEITRPTGNRPLDREIARPGPILLQDHGCPVAFRNVWVLPLPSAGARHY